MAKKKTDEQLLEEILSRNPGLAKMIITDKPIDKNKPKKRGGKHISKYGSEQVAYNGESLFLEDLEFDKKKPAPVSPRIRAESKKVEVKCARCGKSELISERLKSYEDTHYCNKCFG